MRAHVNSFLTIRLQFICETDLKLDILFNEIVMRHIWSMGPLIC